MESSYLENPAEQFSQRITDLQRDLESKMSENQRLRVDFNFLRSEYAHAQQEYSRKEEELQIQYKVQLEALSKDRQNLVVGQDIELQKFKKNKINLEKEHDFQTKRIADLQEEINVLVRDKNQILEDFQSSQRSYKMEQSVRGEEKTKLELTNTALESKNQSANLQLDKQRSALVIAQEKTAVESRKSDELESTLRKLRNELISSQRENQKSINRERNHREDVEKQFREKVTALEALIEAANAQRDEQRRIASEIEHKASKTLESVRSKFQIELNQISSDRDDLSSQIRGLTEKIEDLEHEKSSDERNFQNNSNELTDEIAGLQNDLARSKEVSGDYKKKADDVIAVEAQLHGKSLQCQELNDIYTKFKKDAAQREEMLVNDKREADEHRVTALKELAHERGDIARSLKLQDDDFNRKRLELIEQKHQIEMKLDSEGKNNTALEEQLARLEKREQKIKRGVNAKLSGYKKRVGKAEKGKDRAEYELDQLRRLEGVPLEEYQKLEEQHRILKSKVADFKHKQAMFELKMFPNQSMLPPMLPPGMHHSPLGPSQTMMTEIALNKVRNEQDKLNEAVRQIAITRSPTKNFESMTNFRVKLGSETTETENLDSETITISETEHKHGRNRAESEPTTHVLDGLIDEDEMTQSVEDLSH